MSVGASKNETVGISSTEQVGYIKSTIVGEEYTITVGNSTIHMSAEGTIEITATNFQVSASEYVEIKGKKVCVNGGCEGERKGKASLLEEGKEEYKIWNLRFHSYELEEISDISHEDKVVELHADTDLEDGQTVNATLIVKDSENNILVESTKSAVVQNSQIYQQYHFDELLAHNNINEEMIGTIEGAIKWPS